MNPLTRTPPIFNNNTRMVVASCSDTSHGGSGIACAAPSSVTLTVPPDTLAPATGCTVAPAVLPFSLTLVLGTLLFTYVGAEVGFGGWLLEYALMQGLLGEGDASLLVSLFWGSMAAGRLLAVRSGALCVLLCTRV